MIVQAYGEYRDAIFTGIEKDGKEIICKSKVLKGISLGYRKVTVESPMLDTSCKPVLRKGAPVADTAKRDTENIPLTEDIDEYMKRDVFAIF